MNPQVTTPTQESAAHKAAAHHRHANTAADGSATGAPPSTMARATLAIKNTSDDSLIETTQAHLKAMSDHPDLDNPTPSAVDLQAALDELVAMKAAADQIKLDSIQVTADKNASRAVVETMMTQRVIFVDMKAGGVASIIRSAAMNVRSSGTPTGELPYPMGLDVELNGTPGAMLLTWALVTSARSYLVQWADATTVGRNWNNSQATATSTLRLTDMAIGTSYAFRVAAIGGSTGQSAWSGEVVRMAA